MSDVGDRPWLIDARSGAVTTYGELLEALNDPMARFTPLLRPANTREALIGVTRALLTGSDLTLFDGDFGPREIVALGYREAEINQPGFAGSAGSFTLRDLQTLDRSPTRAHLRIFTSGSSGLPKMVSHTIATLARGVIKSTRHTADVWALAYNTTHIAGLQVYLQALANLNPLVDIHRCGRSEVLTALQKYGVSHISATPTFYRLLLPANAPVPRVRVATLGGESLDRQFRERLAPLFPTARFYNIYASTEAGTVLVAEGDVFAVPAKLKDLVRLHEGSLRVHASLLGEFTGSADLSGEWYDTGDVTEVVSAEPLRFRIVGRKRDWINVGGNKVNPHEVEAVLEKFPGVEKVRVFGRKNSVLGQVVCAEVEWAEDQPTEQALREFAAGRLQTFKVPRLISFVDQLAQTRTGKLQRS